MTFIRRTLLLFGLALNSAAALATANQSEPAIAATASEPPRILAIGDVHGALAPLQRLLRGVGLVDAQNRWIGGSDNLVSLGDLIDRGPDSRAVMDLLRSLQSQAAAQGGQVEVLLGNHEILNLTGDLRDVSTAELASYEGLVGHQQAFAANGEYGRWLLQRPVIAKIEDNIFVHGGISPLLTNLSIAQINNQTQGSLQRLIKLGTTLRAQRLLPMAGDLYGLAQPSDNPEAALNQAKAAATEEQLGLLQEFIEAGADPMLGHLGPAWYRGNAGCHQLLEQKQLDQFLQNSGASRVVIGHTPTPSRQIEGRLQQRVVSIDTGMLAQVYKGKPYALEIRGQQILALNEFGEEVEIKGLEVHQQQNLMLLETGTPDPSNSINNLLLLKGQGKPQLQLGTRFTPLSERQVNSALAAYRLDQMLGLHMVPPVAKRQYKNQGGIFEANPSSWTEQQRQEAARFRPNYCASGSAYHLLAAFDALIARAPRGPEDFGYQRRDWRIIAWRNHQAFGTSKKLPRYKQQPSLSHDMREQLERLTISNLTKHLGDLLKPKQIKALLSRRDRILNWPNAT